MIEEPSYFTKGFPKEMSVESMRAAELAYSISDKYDYGRCTVIVRDEEILIPRRLKLAVDNSFTPDGTNETALVNCLLTRSTNGYIRQSALEAIISLNTSWSAPYVFGLLGDYVREIVETVHANLGILHVDIYKVLLNENPTLHSSVKQRVRSYWNVYHRFDVAWDDYSGNIAMQYFDNIVRQ